MDNLGWIDFSQTHRNKVLMVLDMFKEQGVIDELGVGTIRDSLSDILFPGTSTIQTRAKYFLLIPWIFQDIERNGKIDRFHSELEESEVKFIKVLRSNQNEKGIIGATLRNANPKRKPSSIYWNGLRTYGILTFKGSIGDYVNYSKYHANDLKIRKKQMVETDGNVPGDDKDRSHLYIQHLWCQIPNPPQDWKTDLTISLSEDEATFLKEKIITSQANSLWAYMLINNPEEAISFSGIANFLKIPELPQRLTEIIKLAEDFNFIMQGALIRYNLLIQKSRENGKLEQLEPIWNNYLKQIKSFDWENWDTNMLWKFCPLTNITTKHFVNNWIENVRSKTVMENLIDQMLRDRELRLKGLRRARLSDKAIAQKQETLTGISISEEGKVTFLTYRWNTAHNILIDIQKGLNQDAATK